MPLEARQGDVRADLRRRDLLVIQRLLDRAESRIGLKKVGRKGMPEHITRAVMRNAVMKTTVRDLSVLEVRKRPIWGDLGRFRKKGFAV